MPNDLFSLNFKDEPWNYMYTVHSKTLKSYTFATGGYAPFIYDLARIHRFIQVDGVRTAEGCEGVTGAIIRA